MRKSAYILALYICLSLVSGRVVAAGRGSAIEMTPAYSDIVLKEPDEVQRLELTITNHTAAAVNLEMFPIDFKQADATGTVGFLGNNAGSYSYSLSSFLSFESDHLQLEAGEAKKFVVTIRNRDDMSPGGHYAAVVAKLSSNGETPSQSAKVAPALSSLILLRKEGGERFNLSLKQVDWPGDSVVFGYPEQLTLLFQNEGNIHLIPYGTATIKDMFGRLMYKGIVNTGSLAVFPESRRYITVDMDAVATPFPVTFATLTVEGHDSIDKTRFISRSTVLVINPWALVGVAALVVVLIMIRFRRRRRSLRP